MGSQAGVEGAQEGLHHGLDVRVWASAPEAQLLGFLFQRLLDLTPKVQNLEL